jgi:hypothetical protein
MVETTKTEAILLLRKWQEEKTLLQASLFFEETRSIVLGRIEKIDNDEVQIDGSSRDELGGQYGLVVRFANVKRFCFWRHGPSSADSPTRDPTGCGCV